MRMIVGLGNPGRRYRSTPHNIGFEVADELAARHGLKWTRSRGLDAEVARGDIEGRASLVLKPTTYMNLSGEAAASLVRSKRIDIAKDLLVVVDDVALVLGRLRLREGGSSGGHRGLDSLIDRLCGRQFPRLRCGVGPEKGENVGDLADYVLAKWPSSLLAEVDAMTMRAADAAEAWVRGDDPQKIMTVYNTI